MPSEKLTNDKAKDALCEGDGSSRHVIWDTELRGFGLRVYPSGRKSFVISYRTRGRKRLMVLGGFGTFTATQARERARKKLVMVRDGKDPMEEDRKAAQGKTFGDLKEKYIEEHAKVHKKSWQKDERQLEAEIPKSWDSRLVGSITRGEISAIHAKLGKKHPYGANRLIEVLRKMFNLARIWEYPQTPITAADMLNDKVLPFYENHDLPVLRILTDRGTEYCGRADRHDYQLFLAINDIEHTKTKVKSPQTNGICERFHKTILQEFYQVTFRKKIYQDIVQLQNDLDLWIDHYNNEPTHQGKVCEGRTPMQTLEDGKEIWKEKFVDQT